MSLGIDLAAMAVVLLVALRIGPLFVLAPVFGAVSVPLRVRVFLALAFAALLAAVAGPGGGAVVLDPLALIGAAATEVLLGIGFAFGLLAAFGALVFGGRLLDLQIGFGVATLIDPVTRGQSPLLGTVLNLAVAIFFAVDGHHMLIEGSPRRWSSSRWAIDRGAANRG